MSEIRTQEKDFAALERLCTRANATSREKGFWDNQDFTSPTVILSKIALIMSELGEGVEAVREGNWQNLTEEMADTCIRIFDLCGQMGLPLGVMMEDKMDRNDQRPRMHNKLA